MMLCSPAAPCIKFQIILKHCKVGSITLRCFEIILQSSFTPSYQGGTIIINFNSNCSIILWNVTLYGGGHDTKIM